MAEFFETFIPVPVFDAKKKGGKSVSGFRQKRMEPVFDDFTEVQS